jgi:hypothetical protein
MPEMSIKIKRITERNKGKRGEKMKKSDWLIIAIKKEDEEKLVDIIMKAFPKRKSLTFGSREFGNIKFLLFIRPEQEITKMVFALNTYNTALPSDKRIEHILIDRQGFIH